MTIDERVEALRNTVADAIREGSSELWEDTDAALILAFRAALLETAKDQRHACAEAVKGIRGPNHEAYQAVMNAEIK